MELTKLEMKRSRTRPRTDDLLKHSSSSVGEVSNNTGSTEQSHSMSEEYEGSQALSQDIPLEVVIINDDAENIPSVRGHIVHEDMEYRLKKYETLLFSYRHKLKSSENLNSSLHQYLRQTQGYAENLMSEREELFDVIQEMEKQDSQRIDQELLLKFIMCSSLVVYLFGGSHQFLVGAVMLQLVVTGLNIFL